MAPLPPFLFVSISAVLEEAARKTMGGANEVGGAITLRDSPGILLGFSWDSPGILLG